MTSLEKCKANGGHERAPTGTDGGGVLVRVWYGSPDPLQCRSYSRLVQSADLAREAEITEALALCCIDPTPENVARAFA